MPSCGTIKGSRSSASLPPSQGGLGVVNIASKLASLRVMWVKSFLVGGYHPWKCFFRHFLRRAFLSELVERVFSFTSVGSSTMRRLPEFYQQVLAAWLLMGNRDNLEHLTNKIAYRRIQPAVTHRCITKFAAYHLDWPALWRDLELFFVDKPIWKTNFLILHGILPTVDPTLSSYPDPCRLVRGVAGSQMAGYLLSNAHIRFGHPASAGFPAGFKFLLATLRHYVWVARNSWQFEGTQPDPQLLVEKIESSFRFVSKVQQRILRPTFYEEEWLAGGVL